MKKILCLFGLLLMTTSLWSQSKISPFGQATREKLMDNPINRLNFQEKADDPYELLGCPQGTVFGGEYTENAGYSGFACADLGRTDGYATEFYQHFSDCYYTFNGVRFVGLFNYWDNEEYNWLYCNSRGDIDEDGNMNSPIRFIISFFEENEEGLPGKKVYSKEIDIIGEKTGVQQGMEDTGYSNLYSFTADLGQEIKLEHGYMQVNAVDMGDKPSCWLSLFTSDSSVDYAYQYYVNDDIWSGQMPMIFCFKGNGDFNTTKGLKVNRFLAPTSSSFGKYEKVQIEISNVGPNTVDDATFELWVDDRLVSTEKVNKAIESMESYKYTFEARVDCSKAGEHKIFVKNVTPNDELLSGEGLSMTVQKQEVGDYSESASEMYDYEYISNVTLDAIDNTSEGSSYSDYTDQKAELLTGDEIELTVSTEGEASLGAWIDWNSNYVFENSEKIIFDSYNGGVAMATISIPATGGVTPGEKRMRLVASYDTPKPEGIYDYGETEDYTLVVKYAENNAQVDVNVSVIDELLDSNSKDVAIETANVGDVSLEIQTDCNYVLPNAPTSDYHSSPAQSPVGKQPSVRTKTFKAAEVQPHAASDAQYVLKYDKGVNSSIGISNSDESIYAGYYPGKMLSALSGMTISSIDVYVSASAEENAIVIYEQANQTEVGELLLEQTFEPQIEAWNHIVLDTPLTIGSKDLAVGVKFKGIGSEEYYIGIDEGEAVVGFGDIVSIGDGNWWSMADLGLNNNYCIRANVTGTPTPAISWMTLDKEQLTIDAGEKDQIQVTLDTKNLADGLYEAYLVLTTNDPINQKVSIPVYVINGTAASIEVGELEKATIRFDRNVLTVNGRKTIADIALYGIDGSLEKHEKVNATEGRIAVGELSTGAYLVVVTYTDGSKFVVKQLAR